MHSREDEQIMLEKEVVCTGGVENWLNILLTVHQQSVGAVISLGLQSLRTPEFDILLLIENSVLQVRRCTYKACVFNRQNGTSVSDRFIFHTGGSISITSFMDKIF